MRTLHQFVDGLEGFIDWPATKQIDFIVYYQTSEAGIDGVQVKDIRDALIELDLKAYKRLSAYLSDNNSKKNGKYTKNTSGYRLVRRKYSEISSFVSQEPVKAKIKSGGARFVDVKRIDQLRSLSGSWDTIKLVRFCEELNIAFDSGSFLSVTMLTRAIIDHVPPIFSKKNFSEVASNYGGNSFMQLMQNLDKSSRKIADTHLHTHIRTKETLPNSTQVDFSNALDVLLGEIFRILK